MRISTFWLTFCLILLSSPLMAETMEINGFEFDNPLGPTEVTELGPDAYSAYWPGDKPYKEAAMELIVVSLKPDAVEALSEDGGSVSDYALSTFMGLSNEPEEINKTLFFGSTSARRVYSSSIPRKHSAHVFSKTLDDGSFVLVGIRLYDPEGGGKLIQSIGNTFRKVSP